jgi:hypothetical protein
MNLRDDIKVSAADKLGFVRVELQLQKGLNQLLERPQ